MSPKKYDDIYDMIDNLSNEAKEMFSSNSSFNTRRSRHDKDMEVFKTIGEIIEEEKSQIPDSVSETEKKILQGKIEETFYVRYNKNNQPIKYSDEEMQRIRESCKTVIVHDHSQQDIYHMSDEDRIKNDQLARIAMDLGRLKSTYNFPDDYVRAMRIVYEAWEILAATSIAHSRKEFFELVGKGIIASNRIVRPRLRGIKNYNQDLLFQYINNTSLDPSDLRPKKQEDDYDYFYNIDDRKGDMDLILSPDEITHIINITENPNEIIDNRIPAVELNDKYLRYYDDSLRYDKFSFDKKKKKKKISKSDKMMSETVKKMFTQIQNNIYRKNSSLYSFSLLENMFKNTKDVTAYDKIRFDGSWRDNTAVRLYDLAVDEAMSTEKIPGEYSMTYGDAMVNQIYETMERDGVNLAAMRKAMGGDPEVKKERVIRSERKKNRKLENALIDRISKLSTTPKFKKLIKKTEERYLGNNKNKLEEELYEKIYQDD